MIRYPHEKNNSNFHPDEAAAFNDFIDEASLLELPLLDREFTWSNKRASPTLERLDRAFINLSWDTAFPNSNLSSRTRRTSDHVPLIAQIATHIPKTTLFKFENYWVQCKDFQRTIVSAWYCRNHYSDPSAALAAQLKQCRRALKCWRRQHANIPQQEEDCKIVINLLDFIEEHRTLSPPENSLRSVIVTVLSRAAQAKLTLWKQRSKIRAAIEGDENTRYFHTCANQRRRRNQIQVIEDNGLDLYAHEPKAAVLRNFYLNLLGTNPPLPGIFSFLIFIPKALCPFSTSPTLSLLTRSI
jgi:hypothetical protein